MAESSVFSEKYNFPLLILSISLAIFMSSLDGTIVNIALPTISESFDVSSSTVSWVSTSYLLVIAGCLLIFGKISDSIGFKRVFLSGFILFTTGSFACGFIPDLLGSFYSLVGSRAFQGIGGAMITAVAPAMVTAFIPPEKTGKAMGIIMTAASFGMALGPTIGGALTQYLSWHWIFFINVPVGILAVILGAKVVPNTKGEGSLSGFDKYGAFFIFAGLAMLLFFVSEGQTLGWTSPCILLSLAGAAVFIVMFVMHELKNKNPLLELRLFRNKNFVLMNVIISLVFLTFGGINYLLPFYLEYVQGYETSVAGLILTILSFSMMISGLLAGLLYNRTGGRILAVVAAFIMAGGYFMMSRLHPDTGLLFIGVCLFLIGFGLGLMTTPMFSMVLNSVSGRFQGMVSSLTGLERYAPTTIGIAFYNLLFIQGALFIAKREGVVSSTPVTIKIEVLSAGFDFAFFFAMLFGILVLILALFVKEVSPDSTRKNGENEAVIMGEL
ncbi:EmrB/QacA subfamily drug resistance transporter [Methanomicrobium sp. W14]|uniref:DHA2 family efflux MFS transporter permease subunit n=1 Tax=Methanomicrobium sp. W14 TaxID=2817839 RepID=UPI001AE6F9E2|nr:DHA2 family efflux MFS transporter permease subunit [Methanomicrobium sp. W14]MBP2133645.1 EmrB/QacA subfamily drug resistance transporter [Methanomicrobium sp. W14]